MKKKNLFVKLFAAAMSALLLFGGIPALAVSDVDGHWAQKIIEKWVDAGKINGYEDGTFLPDNNVTRSEFAAILCNILAHNYEEMENPFSDVETAHWFYDDVMILLGRYVIESADNFYPGEYITRQDAMTMIGRAFYIQSDETDAADSFADSDCISDYAKEYVTGCIKEGYVNGYEDNTIRPLDPITRAESVKILDGLGLVHEKNSLEGIIERVYAGIADFKSNTHITQITDESAQYFLGLENLDGIERAIASEPMMNVVPHSICLVQVRSGEDIDALKEKIHAGANPRKWVCVGVDPENVVVESHENLILLVMDNSPEQFVESFFGLWGEEPPKGETPNQPSDDDKPSLVPDDNKLLYTDGYYMDYIGEFRPSSAENFASKIETIYDNYLQNSAGVYYSIIPSKSYFVNDRVQTPFDYAAMNAALAANIKNASYINIFDTLTLQDYYVTDPHWRQENLQKVVDRLGENMGFKTDLSSYTVNTAEDFIGQHGYGKADFPSETLVYLTGDAIDSAVVTNTENADFHGVYNIDKLSGSSPYDMFLSGPEPIVTISNEKASSDKELVLFRDSFACSLAPLLIENYKTITLVDIRYIFSQMLGDYVSFDGKDVLFLYNEQIVNFSEMLR